MRDKRETQQRLFVLNRVAAVGVPLVIGSVFAIQPPQSGTEIATALVLLGVCLVAIPILWRTPRGAVVRTISGRNLVIEFVGIGMFDFEFADIERIVESRVSWDNEPGGPVMRSVYKCDLRLRSGLPVRRVVLFDDRERTIARAAAAAGVAVKVLDNVLFVT